MNVKISSRSYHQIDKQALGEDQIFLEGFSIPLMPKLGIFLNISGCLFVCILILLMFRIYGLKGSNQIYEATSLIPWFLAGFIIGAVSVIFGYYSYKFSFYKRNSLISRNKFLQKIRDPETLFLFALVCMVASNIIFVISSIYTIYAIIS